MPERRATELSFASKGTQKTSTAAERNRHILAALEVPHWRMRGRHFLFDAATAVTS